MTKVKLAKHQIGSVRCVCARRRRSLIEEHSCFAPRIRCLAVFLSICGWGACLLGQTVLHVPLERPGVVSLRASDLDGNGYSDIVALNWGEEFLEVLLRDGSEIFASGTHYEAAKGSSPQDVSIGDVDGDGKLDLVSHERYGSSSYTIFYGDGKGSFPTSGGFGTDSLDSTGNILVDLDGDRQLDRVLATAFGDVVIFFQFFSSIGQQTLNSGVDSGQIVVAADVDGNGQKDVVVWGTKFEPSLAVFLGSPGRLYSQPIVLPTTPLPGGVAIRGDFADLDGDGREELVLLSAAAVDGKGWAYVYIGDWGTGGDFKLRRLGYALPISDSSGHWANLSVADVTGDDLPDIVVQGVDLEHGEGVWVLRNRGGKEATFDLDRFVAFGGFVTSFAVADYDLDGTEDLAFALGLEGRIDVYFSAFEESGGFYEPIERCYSEKSFAGGGAVQSCGTLTVSGDSLTRLILAGGGKARVIRFGSDQPEELSSIDMAHDVAGLTTIDMDQDGNEDLVYTSVKQGMVGVQLLEGSNPKGAPVNVTLSAGAVGVTFVNVDREGLRALATCLPSEGKIATLRVGPKGLLEAPLEYSAGVNPTRVAPGDVDGDGFDDLVVTNGGTSEVSVLKGLPNGGFDAPTSVRVVIDPWDLIVRDLSGDGLADIVVVSRSPSALTVLLSKGAAFKTQVIALPHGTLPTSIVAEDVDGDGNMDLAVSASGAAMVLILKNSGQGSFLDSRAAVSTFHQVDNGDWQLVAGNFDANGSKDLLAVSETTGELRVDFATGCGNGSRFRRGDADGDGSVGIGDAIRILYFLFAGNTVLECQDSADVDDGGTLNIGDSISLLGYLFLGTSPPRDPGPATCGLDATRDTLPDCRGLCF